MSSLSTSLAALYARVPRGMRLGLEPMRAACMRTGSPERSFESVHLAGTNGKGSTCAMVEAIARSSRLRTGMYTSPHLCRFAERIRLDGEPIDDSTLTSALDEALRIGSDLSFFETATLAAFLAFRKANVELAIVEVGIGGRLDATNVIPPPRCAAVTSIGFDHQDMLGDTLAAIAKEKASIAKLGSPVVLGALLPKEAHDAAVEVVTSLGARPVLAPLDLPDDSHHHPIVVGLEGSHQRSNASVAWTIASELGWSEDARIAGLATVRWPGRFERIIVEANTTVRERSNNDMAGPWILDGAHNVDGVVALVSALRSVDVGALVFGALADKAWEKMLRKVHDVDAPRVYVAPAGRTAADLNALTTIAPGVTSPSLHQALIDARKIAGDKAVVVCGSLYLVGAARALLLDLPLDPIVAL